MKELYAVTLYSNDYDDEEKFITEMTVDEVRAMKALAKKAGSECTVEQLRKSEGFARYKDIMSNLEAEAREDDVEND